MAQNGGAHGVHARSEEAVSGYVRRCCLAHMSWRPAEAGFQKMGDVREGWKAISRHLHEGGVWARLKIAATAPVDYGGLELYVQGSRAYAAVFSLAPPTRPETDLRMAEWLLTRMHVLPRLVQHDHDARAPPGPGGMRQAETPRKRGRRCSTTPSAPVCRFALKCCGVRCTSIGG